MNKLLYFIILFLTFTISAAQNLVPNPSFEIISTCPTTQGQLDLAVPWIIPSNTGSASPDLYNTCDTTSFGVPINVSGYQYAHTGSCYAGFYTYGAGSCREYIQVELTSPLIAGRIYQVKMYVSPSEEAGIAVDAIGLYFSNGAISGTGNYYPLPFIPQVSNLTGNIISDTSGWTPITGFYIASGGENYVTIGNFLDDAHTDTLTFNFSGWSRGYYWIDDVSVEDFYSLEVDNFYKDESVKVYPNPFTDKLLIDAHLNELSEIIIYDLSSRVLLQKEFTNSIILNTSEINQGIYFYEMRHTNGVLKKGIVVKE